MPSHFISAPLYPCLPMVQNVMAEVIFQLWLALSCLQNHKANIQVSFAFFTPIFNMPKPLHSLCLNQHNTYWAFNTHLQKNKKRMLEPFSVIHKRKKKFLKTELDAEASAGTNPQGKRMLAASLPGALQARADSTHAVREVGKPAAIHLSQYLASLLWHTFLKPTLIKP